MRSLMTQMVERTLEKILSDLEDLRYFVTIDNGDPSLLRGLGEIEAMLDNIIFNVEKQHRTKNE